MASGNWNGGGDTPSLPTGPTMAAIGHGATREVSLEWPSNSPSPCIGPVIALDERTNGGDRIRIQVSNDEFIWIEKRVQQGYDASLPGEGVLVLFEDFAAGDSSHNAMNIDQRRPYLKTIEADGNQEQLRGVNDGVASDLFQPGDEFGERGILIRDHDGILVPWYARVVEDQDNGISNSIPQIARHQHVSISQILVQHSSKKTHLCLSKRRVVQWNHAGVCSTVAMVVKSYLQTIQQ